jgi:hypothetical protein
MTKDFRNIGLRSANSPGLVPLRGKQAAAPERSAGETHGKVLGALTLSGIISAVLGVLVLVARPAFLPADMVWPVAAALIVVAIADLLLVAALRRMWIFLARYARGRVG